MFQFLTAIVHKPDNHPFPASLYPEELDQEGFFGRFSELSLRWSQLLALYDSFKIPTRIPMFSGVSSTIKIIFLFSIYRSTIERLSTRDLGSAVIGMKQHKSRKGTLRKY